MDEKGQDIMTLSHAKKNIISEAQWDLKYQATNIDRRHCSRIRPMKVLVLDLERTGTMSVRAALLQLGHYDVYHMTAPSIENPRDGQMWIEACEAKFEGTRPKWTREDWDSLLGHCMAVTDQPCASFAAELIESYPEAKIILTVRDSPEAWSTSVRTTVHQIIEMLVPRALRQCRGWNPLRHLQAWLHPAMPGTCPPAFFAKLANAKDASYGDMSDPRCYIDHNENVRQLAKTHERDFLEFNVKQGWEPFCKFLGMEQPEGSFPRINETADYE